MEVDLEPRDPVAGRALAAGDLDAHEVEPADLLGAVDGPEGGEAGPGELERAPFAREAAMSADSLVVRLFTPAQSERHLVPIPVEKEQEKELSA